MKTLSKILLILVFTLTAFLFSCREKVKYPIIPHIDFVSFTKIQQPSGIDNTGTLKISFTDGDGDIGLNESDTVYPYNPENKFYYNFFIDYFEKQNGAWIKVPLVYYNHETFQYDTITFNSRIPVITPAGDNKSIKGDIEINLFFNNPLSDFDTIRFEASIADRALNVSNVITTPDIIVKKN